MDMEKKMGSWIIMDKRKKRLFNLFFSVLFVGIVLTFFVGSCSVKSDNQSLYKLREPVHVIIDHCGTPHIFAESEEDAFFVMGWIQAHYRLFQIDMTRRIATGRVSEIFPDNVSQDKTIKGLGMPEFSKRTYFSFQDTGIMKKVKAYIDGVNKYIDDALEGRSFGGIKARIPPQYEALGLVPEKLKPEDVVALGKLRAFLLSSSIFTEGLFKVFQALFGDNVEERISISPIEKVSIVDDFPRTRITPFSKGFFKDVFSFNLASNNFVVSGKITKTGYSYLENDPHLPVISPSIWLPIHISTPSYSAKGFTFPGVPIVIIGGGDNVCWGVTTVNADVSDILFTKVRKEGEGENARWYVQWGPRWLKADVIEETVKIKRDNGFDEEKVKFLLIPDLGVIIDPSVDMEKEGFTSIVLDILRIRIGDPQIENEIRKAIRRVAALGVDIIDLSSDTNNPNNIDNYAMLFVWTGFKPTSEIASFYSHPKAKDVFDAVAFHRFFQVGAQNFIVADRKGNIAYYPHADYPIRSKMFKKPYFTDIANTAYWEDEMLDDFVPRAINPDTGYIVTANNDVVGTAFDNDPTNERFYIGPAYDVGTRAKIAVDLIEKTKFYMDEVTVAEIINNTISVVAPRFLAVFFRLVKPEDIERYYPPLATDMLRIYNSLLEWDFVEEANSPETLYYEALLHMSIARMVWHNFARGAFPDMLRRALSRIFPDEPGKVEIFYQLGLPPLTKFIFERVIDYQVSLRIIIPLLEGDICPSPTPTVIPESMISYKVFFGEDLCPKNEFLRALSDVADFIRSNARVCAEEVGGACVRYIEICRDGKPENCVMGDFAGKRFDYMFEFDGSENFEPTYYGKKYFRRSMGTSLFYTGNFDPVELVRSNGSVFTRTVTDWYIRFKRPDPEKEFVAWEHREYSQSLKYFCVAKPTDIEIWYAIPGGAADDPESEYFASMITSWACAHEWLDGITQGHCAFPPDISQKLKGKLKVDKLGKRERFFALFSKLETDFGKLMEEDYHWSPVCSGRQYYFVFEPGE